MEEIIKKISTVNRIAVTVECLQKQLGEKRNIHVENSIDKAKGILNELEIMLKRAEFWLEQDVEAGKRKEAQS